MSNTGQEGGAEEGQERDEREGEGGREDDFC
jgi:hypothetical protein